VRMRDLVSMRVLRRWNICMVRYWRHKRGEDENRF